MPFGLTFGTPENWLWFLAGGAAVFVFLAFVLPDNLATALVQRKNLPTMLQALAWLGILLTAGWNIIVLAAGGAFLQALSRVRIELWVWVVLGISILLLAATWLLPWLVRRLAQPQPQQGPQP